MELKAVLFDFDGIFIDTEMARYLSWKDIFESYNIELPIEEWKKNLGRAEYIFDPYLFLENSGKNINSEELKYKHRTKELEIAYNLPTLPGILDRIEEAKILGLSIGVVSSSSHKWVDGHLNKRGLIKKIDVIVCREDSEKHKPDPEPYLIALNKLNIKSENAIAIEDSPVGIAAAKEANLFCIAVPCSMTKDLDLSKADLKISSLEYVRFKDFLDKKM